MPPEAYFDEDWFTKERELLMRPLWHFVAPKMLLGKHNSYVTRKICGIDVVIQNFKGELRAFENVCLHRQNPLQHESQGIRPLVCSYHGWSYRSDGAVNNIPFQDSFYRFSQHEQACLRLHQYPLEYIGNLIFINVGLHPINFTDQFSLESLNSLRESSELFDSEVLVTTLPCRFNWKLAYENLRDSLHPRFLHHKSVYENVKFDVNINDQAIEQAKTYHKHGSTDRNKNLQILRSFSNGGLNEPIKNMPQYDWHNFVDRYGTDDWYLNWLVFPNLHIASGSGGYSFIIENHQPISAQHTDLIIYYVTSRKKRRYATSSAVLLAHLEGAEKVLREDIDILEKIQSGLGIGTPRAQLGDFEHSNITVERWYLDVMEGRHVL